MSLTINTNTASLNAQRNLSGSQDALQTSIQRLSSGLRINSAKDDAAGMAISQRMSSQLQGINQAVRNANDGISLAQTAEGALSATTENLQRIRQLAVQSANATNSASDRAALQSEVSQLKSEIDRVASQTQFNGVKLLDGSFTSQAFQIGANAGETINIASIQNASVSALGSVTQATATTGPVSGSITNLTAVAGANSLTVNGVSIGALDAAGSISQRVGDVVDAINSVSNQTSVNAAFDSSTGEIILTSESDIVLAYGGTGTVADTGFAAGTATAATTSGLTTLDVSSFSGASLAIQQVDSALNQINTSRSDLGAYQSRFQAVINNAQTNATNMEAAKSRITDTDFATETANLTKNQILQQAGTAMLAQANSLPNSILSLLRG